LKKWGTTDAVHPFDLPQAVAAWQHAVETGQPYEFEHRLRRADGEYRWFVSRGLPLHDAGGHIVHWYNLLMEVDALKQSEEKLRRSEADLQDIVGTAARMQHGAAAALAMGIDEVGDRRRNAGVTELRHHRLALPGSIRRGVPMLERAAAAYAEMRADRRDARRARALDAHQVAPVRMAGPGIGLDDFAGQRVGHIDRTRIRCGDAVAAGAEMIDGEPLNQTPPR